MYDPVNTSVFALFKKTDVLNRFFVRISRKSMKALN